MCDDPRVLRGLIGASLIGVTAALASTFIAPVHPFDVDSVLLLLGVVEFDPARVRPHAPGYPLLMALAKVAAHFAEPLEAVRWVAHTSLAGLVVATFALARTLGASRPIAAALLLAVAPVSILYGTVANAYILGALVVTLVLVAALQKRDPMLVGVLFGLACAARPSLMLFATPFCLAAVGRAGAFRWAVGAAPILMVSFGVAMAESGGAQAYLGAVQTSWSRAFELQTNRLSQAHLLGLHLVQALAGAAVLVPSAVRAWRALPEAPRRVVTAWLCAFALVAGWSDGHGYVLLHLPVVLALAAAGGPSSRLLAIAVALSAAWFLAPAPPPPPACGATTPFKAEARYLRLPSAEALRAGDARTEAWRTLLESRVDPGRTAVVAREEFHPVLVDHLLTDARVDGPGATQVLLPSEGTRLLLVACEEPSGGSWVRHEGDDGTRLYERELTAADRGLRPAGLQLLWVD